LNDISVLVCDDSALMRNIVSRVIDNIEGMSVVAKAMNGKMALEKIPLFKPDVIILDIEMPEMNGVEFLEERRNRKMDIPVIVLSSVATQGAAVTMRCLELGASDFITKPNGSVSSDLSSVSDHLVELIASYGGAYARVHGKETQTPDFFVKQVKLLEAQKFVSKKKNTVLPSSDLFSLPLEHSTYFTSSHDSNKTPVEIVPVRKPSTIDIIALGISTGGPNALRDVFKMIDPHLKQPILVVQHMPAGFTTEFAASLDRICPLTVKEAADEDLIQSGYIYIAPGDYHIYVEQRITGNVIRLSQEPARNGHRPSADYLFESVAKVYQNHALGVIMTGMGKDGAVELTEMRKQGAWTLGQDKDTSIVYGMPKVAYEMGAVQKQVPLMQMADEISRVARENSR
jgi:two-component system chemotaxis response regulator CheB